MDSEHDIGTENQRISQRHNVRIRVVFDDSVNFNCAATLNLSKEGVLLSSEIPLECGTRITMTPLTENEREDNALSLLEFTGEVVRSFEDIMVSAYAKDRFRMGIRLDEDEDQQQALSEFIEKKVH